MAAPSMGFLKGSVVKNLPAMQESWIQFQGQEEPLEKGMATHSSILAWRIQWTEESARIQSMGSKEWDMTNTFTYFQACFILRDVTSSLKFTHCKHNPEKQVTDVICFYVYKC